MTPQRSGPRVPKELQNVGERSQAKWEISAMHRSPSVTSRWTLQLGGDPLALFCASETEGSSVALEIPEVAAQRQRAQRSHVQAQWQYHIPTTIMFWVRTPTKTTKTVLSTPAKAESWPCVSHCIFHGQDADLAATERMLQDLTLASVAVAESWPAGEPKLDKYR